MLYQFLFRFLLSPSINGLLYKLLLKVRDAILVVDPAARVNYVYGDFKLEFPLAHAYPFIKKVIPAYSENLGIVSRWVKQKYEGAKAIDVGANIGDSAAILYYHSQMEILCIEGNPMFIPMLEKNCRQIPQTQIETCFVGNVNEKVKAISGEGTARLELADDGIEVKTMTQILEKHSGFKEAKLLKIDTDGFDNKILRASETLLRTSKPVLFFEFDPYFLIKQGEVPGEIFPFLESLSYKHLLLFDNKGRFVCEVNINQNGLLGDLINYYNQNGLAYVDICALHENDQDMVSKIKSSFIA